MISACLTGYRSPRHKKASAEYINQLEGSLNYTLTEAQARLVAAWISGTLSDYRSLMAPADVQALELVLRKLPAVSPGDASNPNLASAVLRERSGK